MKGLLALVFVTICVLQCQAVRVREDESIEDTVPKSYAYPDADLVKSGIEYRENKFYKLFSSDRSTYQYPSEDSNLEEQSDNYPPLAQIPYKQQNLKRNSPTNRPHIEQYLKEVSPTTQTRYTEKQRPENEQKYFFENNGYINKDQIQQQIQLERGLLKEVSPQYILQTEVPQKSRPRPPAYSVTEKNLAHSNQEKQQPQIRALIAYQKALSAHQKLLESEGEGEPQKSPMYITHSTLNKPTRKIVKPLIQNEEIKYQFEQRQPTIYQQQPTQVSYQTNNGKADFPLSIDRQILRQEKLTQYQPFEDSLYDEENVMKKFQQQYRRQQVEPDPRPIRLDQRDQVSNEYEKNTEAIPEYDTSYVEDQPVQYRQPDLVKKYSKYFTQPRSYQSTIPEVPEEKYQQILRARNQHQNADISRQKITTKKLVLPNRHQQEHTYSREYTTIPEMNPEYLSEEEANKYNSRGNYVRFAVRQPSQIQANTRFYQNQNPGQSPASYSQYK